MDRRKDYIVTADLASPDCSRLRGSPVALLDKRGMEICEPPRARVLAPSTTGAELSTPSFPSAPDTVRPRWRLFFLVGAGLVWIPKLGLGDAWQMAWVAKRTAVKLHGPLNDETFRAHRGAAQILSGNGDPVDRSSAADKKRM